MTMSGRVARKTARRAGVFGRAVAYFDRFWPIHWLRRLSDASSPGHARQRRAPPVARIRTKGRSRSILDEKDAPGAQTHELFVEGMLDPLPCGGFPWPPSTLGLSTIGLWTGHRSLTRHSRRPTYFASRSG